MRTSRWLASLVVFAAAAGWACSSRDTVTGAGLGAVSVRLKDAPFPSDSVDSVNVFVTRVDARIEAADSDAAGAATSDDSSAAHGWTTIASPNRVFNLLALRNGVTADLGTTTLPAGHYSGLRLIIDPSRSSVVLRSGLRLTGNSTPGVSFPSAARAGIKVNLSTAVVVAAGDTTGLTLDFDLDQSFVMRGNSITQLGLLFKPVIQASTSN